MLQYLIAVLGLGTLCAAWVLFQQWLLRVDPELAEGEKKRGGCGGCGTCEKRSQHCGTGDQPADP